MNREQRYLRIISGEARGAGATLARAGLSLVEPIYGAAVRLRNMSYDRGWREAVALGRPVISVGNLTVGGTGKTPLVAWLCGQLRAAGLAPAVLMRGYKARGGEKGDEQRLLETLLGDSVPIAADPDRAAGASRVLAKRPDAQVFVLDDGFQHRRVRRDVDLVLIDATQPFGHNRLLPRGLLREPMNALRRASAAILTRASLADAPELEEIRGRVHNHAAAPVFQCDFVPDGFVDPTGRAATTVPGNRALAVCAIGNPRAFINDLRRQGIEVAACLEYVDHHRYRLEHVGPIQRAASEAGAHVVTTMKDWMKLQPLWPASETTQIYIARQRPSFAPGHAEQLMKLVQSRMNQ